MDHLCPGLHSVAMTTNDTNAVPPPFLVIGATGKTGRRVTDQLRAAGHPVRRASRTADTRFDWDDATTWTPALTGAAAAYLVPPETNIDVARFADDAAHAGLDRLVLLSARQPDQGGDGVLPAVEDALRAGSVPVTIVRPSWFVQNFTDGMFAPELESGVLRLPVGDGAEPFIDVADIAAVAVDALTSDRHDGCTYDLSGPDLMTFAEAVAAVGAAQRRSLRFEAISPDEWATAMADILPPPLVDLLGNLFSAIAKGENAYLSNGVTEAIGRAPGRFGDAL